MIRLSHSASEKLMKCGAMYKYHYIDKLRPINLSSALFFGGAVDDGLNALVLKKKKNPTEEEQKLIELGPKKAFYNAMKNVEYNRKTIDPEESLAVNYFLSDADTSILEAEDFEKIGFPSCIKDTKLDDFVEKIRVSRRKKVKISDEDKLRFNRLCFLSLVRKGYMMIDAYEERVYPLIEEVKSVQQKVELPNANGDLLIGFIDVVMSFTDEPSKFYVTDHKTTSKTYSEDSVENSPQLATYCEYLENRNGCYIAIHKNLRKRDPRVRIQVIRDSIPEETFKKTFDNYSNALYNIREEKFEKNFKSGCFFFGSPCPYVQYCKYGKKEGLEKLDE